MLRLWYLSIAYTNTILYYTTTILYYTILYCTILYCTILYYTILYYTILYTVLCYTVLCYTIQHFTLLSKGTRSLCIDMGTLVVVLGIGEGMASAESPGAQCPPYHRLINRTAPGRRRAPSTPRTRARTGHPLPCQRGRAAATSERPPPPGASGGVWARKPPQIGTALGLKAR